MASVATNVSKVTKVTVGDNELSLHPFVMDSVKTSVVPRSCSESSDENCDDDEEEEWSDQLAVRNTGLSPSSTVHIEHSTDVVIGPVTQFHGPVTIYQNVKTEDKQISEGAPEKSKTDFSSNPIKSNLTNHELPKKQHLLAEVLEKTSSKRLVLYSLIVISALILVAFGITLSLKIFTKTNRYDDTSMPESCVDVTASNGNLTFYSKEQWGAESVTADMELLKHPVDYAVIAHSAGSCCESFENCSIRVKNMQGMHIPKSNDIWYNFLIGGDGAIYVGRGWNVKPAEGNNAIVIAFIGDFEKNRLPSIMLWALKELLVAGVEMHKLKSDYKLISHKQTKPTLSPGINVYEAISRLPHFFTGAVKLSNTQ
ncbi:hypothetical protein RI129_009047 [Pyrocoelia pectoralis]|uniref:Uncharacterized protein n=1 Tax=Pyrocoelia pectoralis TaxID=417401 RepID=A0AAN7V6M9_9COLE